MSSSAVYILDMKGKVSVWHCISQCLGKLLCHSTGIPHLEKVLNFMVTSGSRKCGVVLQHIPIVISQVLICRNYRGDMDMSAIDKFMPQMMEREEEGNMTPIIQHGENTFIYIKYNNLYRILVWTPVPRQKPAAAARPFCVCPQLLVVAL